MNVNSYLEQEKEKMGENSFMKKLLKKRLNQKGLTLIELLAVIVILAIVAAIAVPAIGNLIDNSRVGSIKGDALNVMSAANIYFTENSNDNSASIEELTLGGYLESAGSLNTSTTSVARVSNGANTISGSGNRGGVTITFANATQAHIEALANNAANGATTGGTPATVTLAR